MPALSRRSLVAAAGGWIAASAMPRAVFAQTAAPAGPFKLDPLPYPANALEPHIDARTMEIHHDRHHAAYVANLNGFAKDAPQIAAKPIPEILADLNAVPEAKNGVLLGGMIAGLIVARVSASVTASPARARSHAP